MGTARAISTPIGVSFCIARDDEEIFGHVRGEVNGAEPDVGIFSPWVEDLAFIGQDGEYYELTEREAERAKEQLIELASEPNALD